MYYSSTNNIWSTCVLYTSVPYFFIRLEMFTSYTWHMHSFFSGPHQTDFFFLLEKGERSEICQIYFWWFLKGCVEGFLLSFFFGGETCFFSVHTVVKREHGHKVCRLRICQFFHIAFWSYLIHICSYHRDQKRWDHTVYPVLKGTTFFFSIEDIPACCMEGVGSSIYKSETTLFRCQTKDKEINLIWPYCLSRSDLWICDSRDPSFEQQWKTCFCWVISQNTHLHTVHNIMYTFCCSFSPILCEIKVKCSARKCDDWDQPHNKCY